MTETWKPIPGYGGMYDVSDEGRVRSWRKSHGASLPRYLKLGNPTRRYAKVSLLADDGTYRTVNIHVLVLLAFVGPAPEGMECRHLDGDSSNNRLTNLAWGTRSENARDRRQHGTDIHVLITHCPKGHPYAGDNLIVRQRGGYTSRLCRACLSVHAARETARRRARRAS